MSQSLRHYHVFISYRHNDRDKRIAEELQKCLEKYKVRNPKTGQMEWLTVFRDQSELPTSNDLGKDIEMALEASDYLVIICSKDYQKSIWCMRELSYFRNLHNNSNVRILPIITDGEPEECFPPELCFREEAVYSGEALQTVQIPVEPMAADVRGANLSEQIKKLRSTEYMRIAAPVLGVPFDALYQRRARSRFQKILAAVFAALVLATGFGIYNFSVNQKLTAQQTEILESDSRNLAHTAQLLLEDGQRKQALETILQAFPSKDQERPIVPEAVQTLSQMMGVHQLPSYQHTQTYQGHDEVRDMVLSEDGRYLVMITSRKNIVCYDLQKQQEVWRQRFEEINFQAIEEPMLVGMPGSNDILVIEANRIVKYSIPTGIVQWENRLFGGLIDDYNYSVSPNGKRIAFCVKARPKEYDGKTVYVVHFIDTDTGNETIAAGGFSYMIEDHLTQEEERTKFQVGPSGFSADGRYFTLVIEPDTFTLANPSDDDTTDFSKLAVIDLEETEFCGYFTVTAGVNVRRVELGNNQYTPYVVDVIPVTDELGTKCGYYYCIKNRGPLNHMSEEGSTLLAGMALTTNSAWNFQAKYPSVSGRYVFKALSAGGVGAFQIDERMLFVAGQGAAIIELDGSERIRYDFTSKVVQLFEEDDEIQALFLDGSLKKFNIKNGYWGYSLTLELVQRNRITTESCGMATKSANDQMALIPEYASNVVLICKKIGDSTRKEVVLPNFNNDIADVKMLSASDKKMLAVSRSANLPLAILDFHSMDIITPTADQVKIILDMDYQGISADENWLILGDDIWDLSSNTLEPSGKYPWQEQNLQGLSFLALDNIILSPEVRYNFYFPEWAEPKMQWWHNGNTIEVPLVYQDERIDKKYIRSAGGDVFLIGQNGLLAVMVDINEHFLYSGLLVFSSKDLIWRYVQSGASIVAQKRTVTPRSTFAQNHPWIGIFELDGVLRIYDWDSDSYIHQYELNLPVSSLQCMAFFGGDRYVLLGADKQLQILDISNGELLLDEVIASQTKANLGDTDEFIPYNYTELGDTLVIYLKSNSNKNYGLCIDTKNWQIEDKIPDLQLINDSVVITSSSVETMNVYSRWSVEDLLAAARQELSEYSSE